MFDSEALSDALDAADGTGSEGAVQVEEVARPLVRATAAELLGRLLADGKEVQQQLRAKRRFVAPVPRACKHLCMSLVLCPPTPQPCRREKDSVGGDRRRTRRETPRGSGSGSGSSSSTRRSPATRGEVVSEDDSDGSFDMYE